MARSRIEEDTTLKNIYENGTKNLSGSEGSTLAQKSNNAYSTLKGEMNNVISRLGTDTWDDDISVEINGATKTGLDGLIEACKSPADEIMIQAGTNVASYNSGFTSYRKKVNDYNTKVDELNREESTLGSEPSPSHDEHGNETSSHRAYRDKCNTIKRLEGEVDKLFAEVTTWKTYCDGIVENIKGILSPIGSSASSSALSVSFGNVSNYNRESAEKYGYGTDYYVNGTRVLDPNGNVVSETYEVVGPDGKIVETGEINFDSNGNPTISNFYKKPIEATPVETIEEERRIYEQQQIPEALTYLDEEIVPTEEHVTEETTITQNPDGQPDDYQTDRHSESVFADGTEVVSDLKINGEVVEATDENGTTTTKLVPETSVEDVTIMTPGEETFQYHEETSFENGQRDSATGTLSQGDTVVAQVEKDYVADYSDSLTGYDVSVQNQVVETQTATTTISSVVYKTDDSGEVYAEDVILTRDNADPSCGSVMYSNGEGYSVSRNASGNLEVTEYYPDKNGEIQTETKIIGDQNNANLFVTNHETGETEITPINTENPLDQFVVNNTYQTARIDSGYNASAAMDGNHHLWMGNGSKLEVENFLENNPSYTISLDIDR